MGLGTEGYEEALAFRNPDGEFIVLVAEKEGVDRTIRIQNGKKSVDLAIKAGSLNTILI